ncbi:MAG: hypothetical protein B7Y56_15955 [Gallionellales bacterium 35-53-114]|jgi:hypothetical protein|nr:MAG: hypothetical protein B7Y56_15955 [Gallionellales bacterium 35-53-114]HQS60040.1 hypothetical protein [Gallionellaceae bacterium]
MISSKVILLAIGRGIMWLGFIILTTVFIHNNDWFSALASATGSAFALAPVGKHPRYTLKLKIVLLLFWFILAVALQPEPKFPSKQVGFIVIIAQHA